MESRETLAHVQKTSGLFLCAIGAMALCVGLELASAAPRQAVTVPLAIFLLAAGMFMHNRSLARQLEETLDRLEAVRTAEPDHACGRTESRRVRTS